MTTLLPRSVYSAMSEQLNRVNRHARVAADDELRAQLAAALRQIDEMQLYIETLEAKLSSAEPAPGGHALHNRPVVSISEAARAAGVSVATAWRYVESGYWSAEQGSNRRWLVYADQPLTKKRK